MTHKGCGKKAMVKRLIAGEFDSDGRYAGFMAHVAGCGECVETVLDKAPERIFPDALMRAQARVAGSSVEEIRSRHIANMRGILRRSKEMGIPFIRAVEMAAGGVEGLRKKPRSTN